MTVCLPIHRDGNRFEGVACVDILMRDLISDLTAFENLDIAYAFMLDPVGNALLLFLPLLPIVWMFWSQERQNVLCFRQLFLFNLKQCSKISKLSELHKIMPKLLINKYPFITMHIKLNTSLPEATQCE